MDDEITDFLIIGRTESGKLFRPSDWAERLCGVMAVMGADHRMRYSPYVRPGPIIDGAKSVEVDAQLYREHPTAYRFLLTFARDNRLEIRRRNLCAIRRDESPPS
ncbi:MAG: DUF3579 domain-containing protein [Hydrogenophilus sp.]|nr:DUF3579 domain-containing protein [Hydrogenophilus sp.]